MKSSSRIIVNTLAQYIRTIINILLSLYSARLVLNILGIEDYGIFSLIGGVVSMLSFISNSLVGSTQRFLSFYQGKKDVNQLKVIFTNSVILHVFLGLFILIILESCASFIFNGFLNIPSQRLSAAITVYQIVVVMIYISFIAAPYRALLVSRENIIYTSIVDVLNGLLKVLLVLILPYLSYDKLELYGWIMLGISLFDMLLLAIYSHTCYDECILPQFKLFNRSYIKELCTFTGWVAYSTLCITFRTQGLAIVLNKTLGASINAAYGIGSQISGMISFVSSSFSNAVAPQLIAAEGCGNRTHMWMLASLQSKFSFLLLAVVGIPALFEMKSLLSIWLVDVPQYTTWFGMMFLISQIIDMWTSGLGIANRAIGNVAIYTLFVSTPKLLILPLGWFLLKNNYPLYLICLLFIAVETLSMWLRVPLFQSCSGFQASVYYREVILRTLPPVLISCISCMLVVFYLNFFYRFIITFLVSVPIFLITAYMFSLSCIEKNKVNNILVKIFIR